MAEKSNIDKTVSQVLPGGGRDISGTIVNFGLNSSVVQALLKDIGTIDASYKYKYGLEAAVRQALNGSTKQDLKSVLNRIGIYSGGIQSTIQQPFVFSFQNLGSEFPGPAKFYNNPELLDKQRWVLPVPPSDFSVSIPNSPTSVTTVHGFTFTHAGNVDLDELSFEGFLPYVVNTGDASHTPNYLPDYINLDAGPNSPYRYHTPREWVENLVTAMRANQPLIFSVYSVDASGQIVTNTDKSIIEPTAMSVSSFSWDMGVSVGGSKKDIKYSITLKRWRRQSICITNYVAQPSIYSKYDLSTGKKDYNWITVPNVPSVGQIDSDLGPTLAKIAIDVLHDARRWKEIAALNKFYRQELPRNNPKGLIPKKNVKRTHRPAAGRKLKVPK